MSRLALFLIFFLLPLSISASAAVIEAPSKVSAVTVFASGAEVTRIATIDIGPGTTTVLVRDLPASAISNSVRVEGVGSAPLEVGSVDTRKIFVKTADGKLDETQRRRIEEEIEKLRDERAALDGEIEAASAEKTLAQNLAELPKSFAKPLIPQDTPAPDWAALFTLIGGKVAEVNKTILQARIKQREIDERIEVLEGQLNEQPPEETERTEVAIILEAGEKLSAELSIRYQIREARWAPIYDARLDTGGAGREPSLVLVRRAEVSQESGEDWTDVDLTLSTTRPGARTKAPSITPLLVDFQQPPRPAPQAVAPYTRSMDAQEAAPSGAPREDDKLSRFKMASEAPAVERPAVVTASTFQAVFQIPGKSNVMSGVGARKVLIGSESVKPSLKVVTAPRETAAAFLHAAFTHDSPAAFLPGKVSLYRDGVFTGVGNLDLIPPGEEYELGFGLDDAVKVSRVSVKRARGETGIISSSNVDEQHFKITLHNLHEQVMPVLVLDQMPYSEDENIIVEVLPITAQPYDLNYDDKRGVIAWSVELKPKEERELAFSYQIKWPAKRDIVFRPGG